MSHHSTPHLGRGDSKLDVNSCVSDGVATNPKQLLNAYVYDFLVKSRLPQTAKIFVNEADVPAGDSNKSSPLNGGDAKGDLSKLPQSPSLAQFHKDNNLPISKMAMDAPQGFLFEWWQVFWDVYQAKNNKTSTPLATQYYQLQMMKQRQQQEIQVSNNVPFNQFNMQQHPGGGAGNVGPNHPNGMNGPQPNPGQQQPQTAEQQAAQQRMMMQLMVNKQQQAAFAASQNPAFNQMDPQQQQQFLASMSGNGPNPGNMSMQQQMFMMQQQQQQQQHQHQQQQQQHHQQQQQHQHQQQQQQQQQQQANGNVGPGNKIQQHAQAQMNNLRQQQAAAQRQVDHGSPQPGAGPVRPGMPQPHMQGGPVRNTSQGQLPPQQQQPPNQAPTPQQNGGKPGQPPNGQIPNGQYGAFNGMPEDPQAVNGMRLNSFNNGNIKTENVGANPAQNSNRNINALHDYQMQLMLLEKQNKKRLDIARNSGSADPSTLATLTAGMLPPNQQQQQQLAQQGQQLPPQAPQQQQPQQQQPQQPPNPMQTPTNPSKPSPVIGSKPSPKKGKGGTGKRGRKPSVTTQNNNSTTPSNSAATPSHLKKDFSTPLTPTSQTPNDTTNTATSNPTGPKRKRKNSNAVNESPKLAKNGKKDGTATDTIKEESENKNEEDSLNAMVEPSALSSSFHDMPNGDQMFTMDVLEGSGNQEQLFGSSSHNSNGLDDMDFDFNSFLNGNVNDGMHAFNWGGVDAVED